MAAKLDQRIDSLELKLRQLKTQQQRVAARRRAMASRQSPGDDTRRKILVRAIVLAKVDQGVMDGRCCSVSSMPPSPAPMTGSCLIYPWAQDDRQTQGVPGRWSSLPRRRVWPSC